MVDSATFETLASKQPGIIIISDSVVTRTGIRLVIITCDTLKVFSYLAPIRSPLSYPPMTTRADQRLL